MTVTDILSLPGWGARDVQEREERLVIEAELLDDPLACPLCGSARPPYRFGYRPRTLFDLPIRMKPVQIIVRRRRFRCRDCGDTFLDELPGIHPQHDASLRLVEYIEVQALLLSMTFTKLAQNLGVSDKFVRNGSVRTENTEAYRKR